MHLLIITQKHKASDPLVELGGMLLCNLTTHEIGCKTLVGENDVVKQVAFHTLIQFFVFNEERGDSDYYAWIASVLVNISRVCVSFHVFVFKIIKQFEEGRRVLLDKKNSILSLLIPFIRDPNPKRRHGVLSVIR